MFCKAVTYLVLALPAAAQSQSFAKITIKPARSTDTQRPKCTLAANGLLRGSV